MRTVLALLSFSVFACSSSPATPGVAADAGDASVETSENLPADDCDRFAAAVCGHEYHCGWFFDVLYPSPAVCREESARACREELRRPGLIDPGNHEPCVSALEIAKCGVLVPECGGSTAGTLSNGSACLSADQCATAFCHLDEKLCGTCAPKPVEGDPCANPWSDCPLTLFCAPTGRCAKRALIDQPCERDGCAWGLSCVGGKCVSNATEGELCRLPADATTPAPDCAYGLTCVGTCARYRVVDLGQPCGGATLCRGAAQCRSGTCVATQPLGGACKSRSDCPWYAICSGGTCIREGSSVCSGT